jgi:hypothetical protein
MSSSSRKPAKLFRKSSADAYSKRFSYVPKTTTNYSSSGPFCGMKPLDFDSVNDDSAHPLSSLRSCSEYNRIRLDGEEEEVIHGPGELSFWAKLFSWKKSKKSRTETAENFIESENRRRSRLCEEKIPMNPVCENVIPFTRAASIVPTPDRRNISGDSTYSLLSLYSKSGGSQSGGYNSGRRVSLSGSSTRYYSGDSVSFLDETTDMLDVFFGTGAAYTPRGTSRSGSKTKMKPMEIELQDLSQIRRNRLARSGAAGLVPSRSLYQRGIGIGLDGENQYALFEGRSAVLDGDDRTGRLSGGSDIGSTYDPDDEDAARQRAEVAFPRVLSWRSGSISDSDRPRANSVSTASVGIGSRTSSFTGGPSSRTSSISGGLSRTNSLNGTSLPEEESTGTPASTQDTRSLYAIMAMVMDGTIAFPTLVLLLTEKLLGRKVRHLLIDRHQDEAFYDAVRIQPFSSGSYLRGMLIGGLCNMFFHLGMLLYWPSAGEVTALTGTQHAVEWVLYAWLVTIVLLHYAQLPARLHIHLQCFASSRTVEVDNAVATLRSLFVSDYWLLNRALGWVTDLVSVLGVVMGELYMWGSYYSSGGVTDPLCGTITSITTTIVLAFCIRIFIATLFCYSMHDPDVLAEARRRGLSKWDLEVLPTFVFSKLEDVNNPDGCSICLNTFTMGEMLISLPCDKRHSFHANCIRQWLHRQNSCPLCQKQV